MGYLKKFQHDMFVSYGRGPKGETDTTWSPANLVQNWTNDLVEHLKSLLDVELGEKVSENRLDVWFDTQLASNKPLSGELRDRVRNSATFLCVMSEFYLQSEYCLDELNTFIEANPNALEEGRIFVVRMRPTSHEEWPAGLASRDGDRPPGVKFHTEERPGERPETFSWPKPDFEDRWYHTAIKKLRNDTEGVLRRLKEVDGDAENDRSIADIDKSVGRPVFLGYACHEEDDLREELRDRFRDLGIKVVPATQEQDPIDASELCQMLDAELANVDALILIAGNSCEKWPRDEPAGHLSLQLNAAKAHGVPAYVWIVADDVSSIEQEDYQAYLAELEGPAVEKDDLRVRFDDSEEFAKYCAELLNARTPRQGVEQCFVLYNRPAVEDRTYEDFCNVVKQAAAGGKRLVKEPRAEGGQIKLEKLREELSKSSACVLICFDDEYEWAWEHANQINSVLGSDAKGMARIFIIGPKQKREDIADLSAWRFERVLGEPFDEDRLREDISRKIEAALSG